jgi:pyruvate dehydrogenase E2 component (dihydrolipoamide acetyltransferase)
MSIVEWYKAVGDRVEIAEPLLCVETDKAQVDVESAEEGVVLAIVAQSGVLLASGTLIAYVGEPGEAIPADDAPGSEPPGRVQALPVVRKLAQSLGVDLAHVVGTGPGGRVERADVEAAAGAGAGAGDGGASDRDDKAEVSALRRTIARRLTASVQSIPQFRVTAHLDATAAQAALATFGPGLSITHVLLRSVARALREHPALQRIWVEDGPAYRILTSPNVGLAVAGEDSLYVVTIAEPDASPLATLVDTVRAAVERGRSGSLSTEDQAPASISISNLGMFGVDSFDAIVDPHQTAILAVGSVRDAVVARAGAAAVIPQLTVTLTCDHRSVDGVQAAQFLGSIRAYFESDPIGPA